uniref:Uncharacterized protein n=2 Tax=Bursaphelenchus xylophilus TaxID=6326 RepID=A0A1I7SKW0_BURXY
MSSASSTNAGQVVRQYQKLLKRREGGSSEPSKKSIPPTPKIQTMNTHEVRILRMRLTQATTEASLAVNKLKAELLKIEQEAKAKGIPTSLHIGTTRAIQSMINGVFLPSDIGGEHCVPPYDHRAEGASLAGALNRTELAPGNDPPNVNQPASKNNY